MRSVLVTGVAGFIGSHLAEALLERGWAVRGVDGFTDFYDPATKQGNIRDLIGRPGFEIIDADVATVDLTDIVAGVDTVVHLAGEPGVTTSWGQSFPRYLARNVLTTQRLLEATSAQHVERFVYASSSSVYGTAVDGSHAVAPRPISPYGATKLAGESVVAAYAHEVGVSAVSLRYFSVYGPRQRPDMAAHRFIEALLDGQPIELFGDGNQTRDFTYVSDVVDATIAASIADLPPGAVLDVASGAPVRIRHVIALLRELLGGVEVEVERYEQRRGDVARTEGRIALTTELLGWSPRVDLRTGLARQVEWQAARRRRREPGPVTAAGLEATSAVGGR